MGVLETTPDAGERSIRLQICSKTCILQSIVEERVARANATRNELSDAAELPDSSSVDIYRLPERKDENIKMDGEGLLSW